MTIGRLTLMIGVLVISLCHSCKKQQINREIKKIYGTKIVIPDNLSVKYHGNDTLYHGQEKGLATLIIWYDSLQCAACNLKYIEKWNRLFEYCEDSTQGIKTMLIYSPSKNELYKFESSLKITDFNYPVYVDYGNEFADLNSLIANCRSQKIFLLDNNQQIVLVGNPYHNNQMWNLYKSTMNTLITNGGVIPVD